MMLKTLVSTTLAGLFALSLSACAQSTPEAYKPQLSVLANELSPSEQPVDMFALQGAWAGRATLLQDSNPTRTKGGACSKSMTVTWTVDGSRISGTSVNPSGVKAQFSGSIRPDGQYDISRKRPSGAVDRVSGWFADGRAIGYWKSGGRMDYCDFRIDLTKTN